MLVLLWGLANESPLAAVRAELDRAHVATALIDQRDVLATEVRTRVDGEVLGWIRSRGREVDLAAVTAVYARPYDACRVPAVASQGPLSQAWMHASAVDDALASWLAVTSSLVVNRPSAMGPNCSKPFQLDQIRKLGFRVPETLVTTDPEAAQAFWAQHQSVVYKSVSGVRSIVSRLGPEHIARFPDIQHCPTQFQRYIPGTDCRVHVVGSEIFACDVSSSATDYRYARHHPVQISPQRLPPAIEERCFALSAWMGLPVCGIDLRRTPQDEWYCFEVNPSPAFTFYQRKTGQPIGAAITRLLIGALH